MNSVTITLSKSAHWNAVFSLFIGVTSLISAEFIPISLLTIIALPFASYLGDILGWRTIFYLSALLGLLTLIWQYITLPDLSANNNSTLKQMIGLLKQSWVITGLIAIICSYAGYHIFFTYMKPFLQYDLNLSHGNLTITLLSFGFINCMGTLVASFAINKSFQATMISIHVILAIVAVVFLFNQHSFLESIITVLIWGFIFGIIPVGWTTWIARTLPKQAEMAGGLMVASVQLSITLAAALGGMIFDHYGVPSLFLAAACIFIAAIAFTYLSFSLLYKITKQKI